MKKSKQSFGKVVLVLLLTFNFQLSTVICFGQTQSPQSFSYQAVVRDAQGNIMQNQSVSFKFSIIENSASGNVVYAETQTATTNNLGLVVLAIGNGTVLQGTFSAITWGNAPHFFKVELDVNGGSNFVNMGTTQLLSVPYALYSENAGNVQTYTAGTGLTLTGTTFSHNAHTGDVSGTTALTVTGIQGKPVNSTAPTTNQVLQYDGSNWSPTQPSNLISAGNGLNYSGNTLNSVWTQTGANIYNNNTGRVGIGMTAPTGKLSVQGDTSNVLFEVKDKDGLPVFVVYQDSVQVFVDASGFKANKGSFAVNPKAQQKASNTHYLRISPDSTRIYTENPSAGFGIRDISGSTATSYIHLTPNNYSIGHNAGDNISSGMYNLLFGYQAGRRLYSGGSNICIGYQTGFMGYNYLNDNILLGNYAGYNCDAPYNIFIGNKAGYNNIKGYDNIYIGNNAAYTSLGYDSVPSLWYHAGNVIIGTNAGKSLTTLQGNTIIGSGACQNSTNSSSSTILGCNACQDGNLSLSTVIGVMQVPTLLEMIIFI